MCTLRSLQCNCACELCEHPLEFWNSGIPESYNSTRLLCIAYWWSGWPSAPKSQVQSQRSQKYTCFARGAQGTYMICMHYHIDGNNCLFILFFLFYKYFILLSNSKVPAKEVVIVSFMLLLWLFSIYRCLCRIASDIILSPKLINPATQVTH